MRAVLASVLISLASCSSTQLVSERVGPASLDGPLRRVVVIGVSDDPLQRVRFEKSFGEALARDAGVDATAATALIDAENSLDYDALRPIVEDGGFDGVLLVRKINERAEVREVRTGVGIPEAEESVYADFHGRYLGTIRGATTENVTRMVRAEITLLRTGDYAEVWTAATDLNDPRDLDAAARDLARVTVAQLRAHRIL